jgi:alkylation response protein AidB-like acyl-CoA dehydrogenase
MFDSSTNPLLLPFQDINLVFSTRGDDVTLMASMLKLKAGRLAREITDSCLQYWGGMGFTNDVYVSRSIILEFNKNNHN